MARGQEREIKGGELSPYVQQSLSQGRAAAENRLVAAMNQAGAAQRQKQAQQAQSVQQGVQMGAEAYQAAAQREQQDKRAAEAEAARREEMKLRRAEADALKEYRDQSLSLSRAQLDEVKRGNKKREDIEAERLALDEIESANLMRSTENNANAIISSIKLTQNNQATMEKFRTKIEGDKEKYNQQKEMFGLAKERAKRSIDASNFMNFRLIGGDWSKQAGVTPKGIESIPTKPTAIVEPLQALQEAANRGGSKVTIEMVRPEANGEALEKAIAEGKVDQEDVTEFMAAFSATREAIANEIDSADTDKMKQKWIVADAELDVIERIIKNLRSSDTRIQDSNTETVGMRMRKGLSPTAAEYAPDFRGMIAKKMDELNQDSMAVIDDLTKPTEPVQLYNPDPEDISPMAKAQRKWDTRMKMAFPEKYPAEAETPMVAKHSFSGIGEE